MKYFRELNLNILKDKVVILDVDGTITYDKEQEVGHLEKLQLEKLKDIVQNVFLVSNGDKDRTKKMAEIHEILCHISEYQKPHRKVLHAFPHVVKSDLVILGDKFLTDGLLALQAGIPFLHVKSLVRGSEPMFDKLVFYIDDLIGIGYELFKVMRPKQWVKNLLVFAPLFFAGEIFNLGLLLDSVIAFFAFSLSASLIYILNDLSDLSSDREHHKKRFRPIASYNLNTKVAGAFSVVLVFIVLGLLTLVPNIFNLILIYILSNILYTVKFKKIPVFDVVLVASMYVMRVVVGGLATSLFISPWIIACTFFASLFVISSKRYVEFQNPVRSVLKRYTKETLDALLVMSATLSVVAYVLYTILGSHVKDVLYTSVFVISVFMIMLNDIFSGNKKMESPEIYLFTNRHILFCFLGWLATFAYLIYVG